MRNVRAGILILELAVGCSSQNGGGYPTTTQWTGGSATVEIDDLALSMWSTQVIGPSERIGDGWGQLTIELAGADSTTGSQLSCMYLWSTVLAATAPLALADACLDGAVSVDAWAEPAAGDCTRVMVDVTVGTISVSANLDENDDGDITLQLDIPRTAVITSDRCGRMHTLHVSATALTAVTTYVYSPPWTAGEVPVPWN